MGQLEDRLDNLEAEVARLRSELRAVKSGVKKGGETTKPDDFGNQASRDNQVPASSMKSTESSPSQKEKTPPLPDGSLNSATAQSVPHSADLEGGPQDIPTSGKSSKPTPTFSTEPDPLDDIFAQNPSQENHSDSDTPEFLDNLKRSEFWFNKIGIGLLLLGIGFLFKYSIDQGWLGPISRIAIGALLSIALLTIGIIFHESRKAFAEVLQGGGFAGLYLTIFAAFQWYELLPYSVAISLAALVSVGAGYLSLQQNRLSLSLIAVLGALTAPFLLYTEDGSAWGLILYTTTVLLASTWIFSVQRWWALQWVSILGGWAILLTALLLDDRLPVDRIFVNEYISYSSLPVLVGFFLFGALHWPVFLAMLTRQLGEQSAVMSHRIKLHFTMMLVYISLIGGIILNENLTGSITNVDDVYLIFGIVLLATSAVYQWFSSKQVFVFPHFIAGILLLNLALAIKMSSDQFFVLLWAQMAIMFILKQVQNSKVGQVTTYLVSLILLIWTISRFVNAHLIDPGVLNPSAIANLFAIGMVFLIGWKSVFVKYRKYWFIAAHILVFGWVLREFQNFDAGQAWVTIIWASYAIGVLIFALRMHSRFVLLSAGSLLLVIVLKLFIIDLSQLETIWRILLFIGFGLLFLVISYRLQNIWTKK